MKRMLVGCLAAALLVSSGWTAAEAKGKQSSKPKWADKNKDGIPDDWELKYKLGLGKNVANQDNDRDGLTNRVEYNLNLNPTKNDTDKDKILDADEDTDRDGLTNGAEVALGTKPEDADSDNDRIKDGAEKQGKTKLANVIQKLELQIKTAANQTIKVDYHWSERHSHLRMKDQTGEVTASDVQSLINDLQASPSLSNDEVIAKIQTLFSLDVPFRLELEWKYGSGWARKLSVKQTQDKGKNNGQPGDDEDDDDQGHDQNHDQDDDDHDDGNVGDDDGNNSQ
ncbi:thrombospondin type 3 repeat-containing protein [Geobacillus jurassicus]|uniref:Thrombospondin type 3 repeat-containing protein n=1 Tax=Geobacillus jurassicus TaxID=235932 RepID=A0ABV6GUA0_9BACL|nr:thrombospondin type 3 repeat-containing protein [Geobacillus jurassicus]